MTGQVARVPRGAPLSRTDDRRTLLLALGAAGVTLAVALGIIAIPAIDACSTDPRGVVSCLRDMANRKFDLPGTILPGTREALPEAAPMDARADRPKPVVAVDELPIRAERQVDPLVPQAATDNAGVEPAAAVEPVEIAKVDAEIPPAGQGSTFVSAPLDQGPVAAPLARPGSPAVAAEPVIAATDAAQPIADPEPQELAEQQFDDTAAEPVVPPPAPAVAAPLVLAPTIDAIELDGGSSVVSGSGPAGALMRFYADGKFIGETSVEDGRWLIEAGDLLSVPKRQLRVEAIEPGTGKVLGESAITIEIELPSEPATPVSPPVPEPPVAPDPGVAPAPVPEPIPDSVVEPSAPAPDAPPAPVAIPDPIPDGEPQTAGQPNGSAPLPPPDESSEPAPAPEPLPPLAPVTPAGESASVGILASSGLRPTTLPPLADITHEPATVVLDPPHAPALVAQLAVPDPRPTNPVKILRLLPFGDPVNGRFTGRKALIRQGDTLWSIAHRYYGHGIHYRTILKANRDLIRRASRIFPGQVLDLPLVTEE
ncbi:MAG: hypothetical protein JWQ89_4328 [Devosia sp.]|uniref:LysM peptidoglycan-binding domain-containing protein n=1 Tax=Devosia sp. TaxID=1871048 RepID=UPI002617CBFC|nr:LysM peptidoglycan-binding domain-containing protein [Devosia sp.]MDB5542601.1 hypothetical protein [Devosia sp.]